MIWIQIYPALLEGKFLLTRRLGLVCLTCASILCSNNTQAEPVEEPGIMRVFVPADQLSGVLSRDYEAVPISELQALLEKRERQRRARLLDVPQLEEAIYVARLNQGALLSDVSRWKFTGNSGVRAYQVGEISLALRPARGATLKYDPLLFTSGGDLAVPLGGGTTQRLFGFSALPTQAPRPTFQITLPVATSAMMLVATERSKTLTSPDVVIEKIADPSNELPRDWPVNPSVLSAAPDEQWWKIYLSGVESFDLQASVTLAGNNRWHKHLLASSEISYTLTEEWIEAAATFELVNYDPASDLRLRVDKDLRISTLTLGGIQADWQVRASLSGETNLLEIANPQFDATASIELTALCTRDDDGTGALNLPQIAVAEAFALQGATRVRATQGLAVENVDCEQAGLSASFEDLPGNSSSELSGIVWDATWFGQAPDVRVHVSQPINRWQAESLTTFSANPEWLAATCHMRLSAARLSSNELVIPVGKGWFVDRVQLISPADGDVTASFAEKGNDPDPTTEVLLNWNQRQKLEMEIQVVAHRPLGKQKSQVRLLDRSLLKVPDAEQIDHYVLEPSGRYRVVITADVLPHQRVAADLPVWQQRYLPQLTDKWIFQGVRGNVPDIDLISSRPTFSSSIFAVLKQTNKQPRVDYSLRVQPVSGLVSEVTIEFPKYVDTDALNWELSGITESNAGPVTWQSLPDPNYSVTRVQLPEPRESAFALTCELQPGRQSNNQAAPNRSDMHWVMALPIVRESLNSETIWVGPKHHNYKPEWPDVDLLPSANCCEDANLATLMSDNSQDYLNSLLAGRMDSKHATTVWVDQPTSQAAPAWIWKEDVQHWIDGKRLRTHLVEWHIEVADEALFKFELPAGWRLDSVSIDGARQRNLERTTSRLVTLELPKHGSSTVLLRCTSEARRGTWICQEQHQKPLVDLPIADSTASLHIPPDRTILSLKPPPNTDARLLDRLNPGSWWRWLSPALVDSWPSSQPDHGWSSFAFSSSENTRESVYIADRGSLASLLLSATIVTTIFFFLLFGRSVRTGWLTLGFMAVALVLVPSELVGATQLLLLSAALAGILRLGYVVVATSNGGNSSKPTRQGRISSLIRVSSVIALSVAPPWFSFEQTGAQEPISANRTQEIEGAANESEVYGVLIPVKNDEERLRVDGSYAYVRSELYDLLLNDMQSVSRSDTARVLSANYVLRINGTTTDDESSVQELSATFRVLASGASATLRLPILGAELPVSRLELNGQNVPVSESLVRQEESATVIRQLPNGNSEVKLFFRPEVTRESGGRLRLLAQIPAIPASTLRVATGSAIDFRVLSAGSQDRSSNEVNAALGPIAELDCSWLLRDAGQDLQAAQATSHLWAHCSGDQIAVAALLEVTAARTLPERFHIIADSAWEPVGRIWGDAELLANQDSVLSNRKKYELRFRDLSQVSSGNARVRVMLVPRDDRNTSALPLPFLYLQEANQSNERTVTWSSDRRANWSPEGIQAWPVLANTANQDWGQLAFSGQARTYRVPIGFLATNLVRVSTPSPILVDEATDLHYLAGNVGLKYQVAWKSEVPAASALRFKLPPASESVRVLVDGQLWSHRLMNGPDGQSMLAFAPSPVATMQNVEVELRYPYQFDQSRPSQRVVLKDVLAETSVVRFFRGVGLNLELETTPDTGLTIESGEESASARNTLEQSVAFVDLHNSFRESSEIPVSVTATHGAAQADIRSVVYVDKVDEQWQAKLIAEWDASATDLKTFFLELPTLLKNDIEVASNREQFVQLGDSTRVVMALPVTRTVAGKGQVELQFPLIANNSTQSLSLPELLLLSADSSAPAVALPRSVNGKEVAWSTSGLPVNPNWQDEISPVAQSEFEYFNSDGGRLSITWETQRQQSQVPLVNACRVRLESVQGMTAAGVIDYWIDPRGQSHLDLQLPEQFELIGCMVGDRTANLRRNSSTRKKLSVLLQPNYAPVIVRMLVRWPLDTEQAELALPSVNAEWSKTEVWAEVAHPQWLPHVDYQQRSPRVLAEAWRQSLEDARGLISSLEPLEKESWLRGWHPFNVGLAMEARLEQPAPTNGDVDPLRVTDFWDNFCANLAVESTTVRPSRNLAAPDPQAAIQNGQILSVVPDNVLQIQPLVTRVSIYPKLLAAGMLTSVVLLALLVGRQLKTRYFELLSRHPWVYWLQLGGLLWLFLPVVWPSLVLVLTAVGMAVSQMIDHRRAIQFR